MFFGTGVNLTKVLPSTNGQFNIKLLVVKFHVCIKEKLLLHFPTQVQCNQCMAILIHFYKRKDANYFSFKLL